MSALEAVLSQSASLNRKLFGKQYKTPLLLVVELGTFEAVRLFVQNGADIAQKDHEGKSAVHYALKNLNDPRIFEYLLEQGVDVHERDANGWQLLHHAVLAGNSRACHALLRRGADLWSRSGGADRQSPFFLALESLDGYNNMLQRYPLGQIIFKNCALRAEEVVRLLIRQAAVYEYLALRVDGDDTRELCAEERLYLRECVDELNSLGAWLVYRSITMRDVFVASDSALDNYYRNPEFLKSCERLITIENFPKYKDWLQEKFDEQIERQKWLARVAELLGQAFGLNDPYHIVIREVTSYFSNDEMKKIGQQCCKI